MRLHEKLQTVLLPAVLILFAILANPAFASGRNPVGDTLLPPALRDSFPDAVSYPATSLSSVDTSQVRLSVSPPDGWPELWWRSATNPFLDSVLPGIAVFRVPGTIRGVDGPSGHDEYFALHKGKFYKFEKLNDLLQDAGLAADTSNWPTIARIAAMFAVFAREFMQTETGLVARGKPREYIDEWTKRGPLDGPQWTTDLAGGIGFPSLTILKVEGLVGNRRSTPYLARLQCLIDGKRCTMDVRLRSPNSRGWRGGSVSEIRLGSRMLLRPDFAKW